MFTKWLGDLGKALYEMSIMSHQAKEGPNFSVSLWRCIFDDDLHIDVAGSNTILGHPVGQVIYFLPKQTTLQRF